MGIFKQILSIFIILALLPLPLWATDYPVGIDPLGKRDLTDANAHCIDAGSTDTYACNLVPAITAYVTGTQYRFLANTDNTGAASINFNGLGLKNIKKFIAGLTVDPIDGDICAAQYFDLVYNGTNMILVSPTCTVVGDVTAAAVFGADNLLLRSDGTGKGTQPSGITINDSDDIAGANSMGMGGATDCGSAGTAGCIGLFGGTAQTAALGTNEIRTYAPTAAATTAHKVVPPGVASTGFYKATSDGGSPPIVTQSIESIVKTAEVIVVDPATATSTGDGKAYYRVPSDLNGFDLTGVVANVITAGTTGTINFDIDKCTAVATGDVCSGTVVDLLSTNGTIDSGENDTATAAAALVISVTAGVKSVVEGDILRFNIDGIHTTPANGLIEVLDFTLPQ